MISSSELRNMTALSDEARQAMTSAFDALSQWRDDMTAANDRWLAKVLDQMAAAARTMGWPDQAIGTLREQLRSASKMQTRMIDQVMDAMEQQLRSSTSPMGIRRGAFDQMPGFPAAAFPGPMPEMLGMSGMAFAPWQFWMQTAEMWQRNWVSAMASWADSSKGSRSTRLAA
jgi:hypothetical protein